MKTRKLINKARWIHFQMAVSLDAMKSLSGVAYLDAHAGFGRLQNRINVIFKQINYLQGRLA